MRQGYAAYQQAQVKIESGQQIEYRLLGQVTGALLKAEEGQGSLQDRINAILWNDRVWNAFNCDLREPGNRLPQGLKNSLISLAQWVARESQLAIDGKADLRALINVNRQVMEGLQDQFRLAKAS